MKTLVSIAMMAGFFAAATAFAAAPASAPAGTTGQCKDGSFTSAAAKKGACHGHKGVKEWYAADAASSTSTTGKDTTASSSSKKKHAAASTAASSSTTAAATPAGPKPADATGLCNDGTYYTGENKKGACRGHKGVKDWYGASATSKAPAATPAPATMPAQTFPKPTPTTMPNANTPTTGTATGSRGTMPGGTSPTPVAGGGAGKVWVNTSTKVYHCQGDRYYGTTKEGEYMSEADATAKGNRPAHGKACSS